MELTEVRMVQMNILEEASSKNGGRMKVKGIFTVADEVNGNGRVYKEGILDREIDRLKEQIAENSAYAEGDHPVDGKSTISNTVALLTGIEKKTVDNRKIYEGESTILNTTKGKDLQEIIRAGGKVGVSSRGWGSLIKGNWNGVPADIVQEDYTMKTFDFVIGQSTKDATISQFNEQMDVINILSDEGKRPLKEEKTKGGTRIMEIKNLDELRKAYPELCLQLETETKAKVEKELKEQFDKEIEKKVLAEIEAKHDEIRDEVLQEIKDSDDYGKPLNTLVEVAKLVRPYIVEESEEDATAKLEALTKEVEKLKGDNKSLKEQGEQEKKATDEKGKAQKKIEEVTAGEKYGKQIAERLADCKTVEEVTKRFDTEKKFIAQLTETQEKPPKGEGKTGTEEDGKVLTEAQQKQRKLAGLEG